MSRNGGDSDTHSSTRKPNRLIGEKSPYLLEHAYNPVDWFPWGNEAFNKAKKVNKPIFLSIGYSSCHWCHVFRKESLEDEDVAKILNENFVCIKVDREERPDIDEIYMKSVMSMTGTGGWPLNVFLTPNLEPFYGGTYFPPTSRHGLPGFSMLLRNISSSWKSDRKNITDAAQQMKAALTKMYESNPSVSQEIDKAVLNDCLDLMAASFDEMYGGFGSAPKFPSPTNIFFLLRQHRFAGSDLALRMAEKTLGALAEGGIRDQIGGGFHRYSTDRQWIVPHFEKMLYDNALLSVAFLEAYLVTKKSGYALVAEDTLNWVLREMTSRQGGFYSAVDADSPEGEGSYYVWTVQDVKESLGRDDSNVGAVCSYFGVTSEGNFEDGKSILTSVGQLKSTNGTSRSTPGGMDSIIGSAKDLMLAFRNSRPKPAIDDKILTSWNGLMIAAFAQGYKVLGDEKFLRAAENAAHFILSSMKAKDSQPLRLYRRYREGESKGNGFLEDYSFLANGLLDLYEASFNPVYLVEAIALCNSMISLFWDEAGGGFFLSENKSDIIARPKDSYDGAAPSGNSMAALACYRVSEFNGDESFRRYTEKSIKAFWNEIKEHPTSFTQMLVVLSYLLAKPKEIVISGNVASPEAIALIKTVRTHFIPESVTLHASSALESVSPLVKDRIGTGDGKAKAYVCSNFSCELPATNPDELSLSLKE
ncbi:MAG: thioredoxin domain-containing protein [Nitrososphaerota archaeon]|nr:thioredoxin domain-containing protein [Nitrososphaerota archaeon]